MVEIIQRVGIQQLHSVKRSWVRNPSSLTRVGAFTRDEDVSCREVAVGHVPAGQELEAVGDVAAPDDQLVDVEGKADAGVKLGKYGFKEVKMFF